VDGVKVGRTTPVVASLAGGSAGWQAANTNTIKSEQIAPMGRPNGLFNISPHLMDTHGIEDSRKSYWS